MASNGSGARLRQQQTAKYAYALRQDGKTNREIAALIGKPIEKVPAWIERGKILSN